MTCFHTWAKDSNIFFSEEDKQSVDIKSTEARSLGLHLGLSEAWRVQSVGPFCPGPALLSKLEPSLLPLNAPGIVPADTIKGTQDCGAGTGVQRLQLTESLPRIFFSKTSMLSISSNSWMTASVPAHSPLALVCRK